MGEIIYLPNKSSTANILHDMASPLSALETAMNKIDNLNEQDKKMIKLATLRLRDLLNKNRSSTRQGQPKFSIKEVLLESIYEKEYEHKIRIGCLELQRLDSISVAGEEGEFRRIFSNLVNNSFEALISSDIKKINVIISIRGNLVNIDISDNGIGLTDEQIRNIMIEQKSYKHKGPGLGVAHAKSTLESWGGSLVIKSNRTVGTTVTATLPIIKNLKVL